MVKPFIKVLLMLAIILLFNTCKPAAESPSVKITGECLIPLQYARLGSSCSFLPDLSPDLL